MGHVLSILQRPTRWARTLGTLVLLVLPIMMLRPAYSEDPISGTPTVCRIGVNIEDLYDLDMAGDTFGAILWVWSVCPSAELKPLETIVFPTARVGLNLDQIKTEDVSSGLNYAYRRVQGTFRYNWDMDNYPFDRHRVVIPIDETHYGAARLVFEPDVRESFLTPDIRDRLDEWRVSDLTLEARATDIHVSPYPAAVK
jgi:hypothetical protein